MVAWNVADAEEVTWAAASLATDVVEVAWAVASAEQPLAATEVVPAGMMFHGKVHYFD